MGGFRFVSLIVPLFLASDLPGQAIQRTVASAESEGQHVWPKKHRVAQASVENGPSSGTSARHCVAPPTTDDSLEGNSLRSGEFIARTRFTGRGGFRVGRGQKVMWLPLHAVRGSTVPLLVRAAHLEQPSDSLRQTIPRLVYSHGESGYPSNIVFSTAGDWLVVATAASDWGCFLIRVAP